MAWLKIIIELAGNIIPFMNYYQFSKVLAVIAIFGNIAYTVILTSNILCIYGSTNQERKEYDKYSNRFQQKLF